MLYLTSSATNSRPLWNLTPLRSLKTSVAPSFWTSHDSARAGWTWFWASKYTRSSYISACHVAGKPRCGSSVDGSAVTALMSVPPRFGVAAAAAGFDPGVEAPTPAAGAVVAGACPPEPYVGPCPPHPSADI